jgi:hypothetical protein
VTPGMFRKVQTLRVTAHPRSRRRKITPVKKTHPSRVTSGPDPSLIDDFDE